MKEQKYIFKGQTESGEWVEGGYCQRNGKHFILKNKGAYSAEVKVLPETVELIKAPELEELKRLKKGIEFAIKNTDSTYVLAELDDYLDPPKGT